jgi:hypothetical protein
VSFTVKNNGRRTGTEIAEGELSSNPTSRQADLDFSDSSICGRGGMKYVGEPVRAWLTRRYGIKPATA